MSRLFSCGGVRLALSTTDLLLLIVMVALVKAHLIAALAGSLLSLLFAIQHAAIIVLTLVHRPAHTPQSAWRDVALAWAGTLLPLAMRPSAVVLVAGAWLLVVLGSLVATGGILSLGRSFGMEPAHRGIQICGLYRVVRHPIYAAYLLIVGGFLLTSYSWWNGLVTLVWLAIQMLRIHYEERLLRVDPTYMQYVAAVPYRLIPGLW